MLFWRAMAKNDENGESCENKTKLARHIFVIGEFCKFFGRDSENVPVFFCPALLFFIKSQTLILGGRGVGRLMET